jgi:LEA14-like dessication related protein
MQDPEFRRIERFRIKNLGLQETTIGFDVTYFNPNQFGVTVKETAANIYIDSLFLGTFTQDSTIYVRDNSEFSIPLSGTIPVQKALQLNLDNITSRQLLLKADGSVKVGKAGIYITRPIHYQGSHRLSEIRLFPTR